ncbi:MAG: hypothetical protein HYV38_00290 [Candidatus Levybacteria bacterium]|nr:hypothetical protein [Candidatus Levybacteria bacterium]
MKTLSGLFFCGVLLFVFLSYGNKAEAAALYSISDTITTSRPSAATPLSADAASSVVQVSVANNGSRFLASDSARIRRTGTDADIVTGLTVATQSAALTTVYFTGALGTAAQAGTDVAIVNITAMHTISFKNPNPIPVGGKIVIVFPGSATNPNYASPSATMFSFNGVATGNIKANFSAGTAACTFSITLSSNTITCTTSTAVVTADTTVTILIGCSANTGASCTTQVPTLLNPSKTAASGTADTWTVSLTTQDASSIDIDTGKTKIGTIASVQVVANVDPTLTFTIGGIANAAAINTGNTTGCTNTEVTNTGIASTATDVNMGTLSNSQINISAQLITISTNAINGYALTATSSGQLINAATGFAINSSTTPTVMTAGTPWFGLHPCGLDIASGTWATGATGGGAGAKYAWPTRTTSVTLASDTTGPIGNTITTGNGLTSVEYASTIDVTVPSGTYTSIVTYVATATF